MRPELGRGEGRENEGLGGVSFEAAQIDIMALGSDEREGEMAHLWWGGLSVC